jgi:ferritin
MLSEKLQKALNEQINKELFSEYLYLSITAYFHSIGLDGFANWFEVQTKEEHDTPLKNKFYQPKRRRVILEVLQNPNGILNLLRKY